MGKLVYAKKTQAKFLDLELQSNDEANWLISCLNTKLTISQDLVGPAEKRRGGKKAASRQDSNPGPIDPI